MTPINARDFRLAHYATQTWRAVVPVGTTAQDLVDPLFWSHCRSNQINEWDKIDVISEDGSLDAELRVAGLGPHTIITRLLRCNQDGVASTGEKPAEGIAPAPGAPRTEFTTADRWRVVSADGEIIQKGLASVEEAEARLAEHLQLAKAA